MSAERNSYRLIRLSKLVSEAAQILQEIAAESVKIERCPVCDWPMASSVRYGCVPGNCSYRPVEGSEEHRRVYERRMAIARERTKMASCDACRHWEKAGDHHLPDHGYCKLFSIPARPEFGCNKWEGR